MARGSVAAAAAAMLVLAGVLAGAGLATAEPRPSLAQPAVSPDGKEIAFVSGGDLWTVPSTGKVSRLTWSDTGEILDGWTPDRKSPYLSTALRKADIAFTPDSKEVFYLEGGVVTSTPLDSPCPKPVAVAADLTIDFETEKRAVFDEAWSTLNQPYFDATFHGRGWAALRQAWTPFIEGAATPDELRRDINLMIGELDASHSGINGGGAPALRVGDLGLRFERGAYESGKGLVVREVTALGPAAIEGSIKRGDVLLAVNGQALGQRALGLPTVLVVNESSLSDAEDVTEGYRALGLGKVVGFATAGRIIFTGGRELIDGSVVRVPGARIQTTSGEDMEGRPRPVDITVERSLGESETGRDAQLEVAVAVLLKGG